MNLKKVACKGLQNSLLVLYLNHKLISGAIGWAVKTAVENCWTVAVATVEVPFVNLVYTIDLP